MHRLVTGTRSQAWPCFLDIWQPPYYMAIFMAAIDVLSFGRVRATRRDYPFLIYYVTLSLTFPSLSICYFCHIKHQEAIWTSKPRSDGWICRMEDEIWQRNREKQAVAWWTFKGIAQLLAYQILVRCSSDTPSTMLMWELSSQVKASLAGAAKRLELLQKVLFYGQSNLVPTLDHLQKKPSPFWPFLLIFSSLYMCTPHLIISFVAE